ncbi:Cysteine-rich PDZ-binding protein [Portunus trituberculatus]|uniref:Cysteine-rich PDZ-binding protein n=1 Tax=Portunus trituberculatus TaxID=210409 RepID=A0A5B7EM13_PORTR|nr:Cysteine-rich PDZ-binding protein [Portunus trituberculatus]
MEFPFEASPSPRLLPQSRFAECRICRSKVHQAGSHFCQGCAYKKGICAMCGKKILDTTNYRQSSAYLPFLDIHVWTYKDENM